MKILLIDDDSAFRQVMANELQAGWAMTPARPDRAKRPSGRLRVSIRRSSCSTCACPG